MRSHEHEIEGAGRIGNVVTPRAEDHTDLAALALAEARPSALDRPAVVHLQASAGNASVSRLLSDEEGPRKVRSVVGSGGGEAMDPATAQLMEARLGEDFGDVRIHRDGRAADSARAVNAHAYTVGRDIVFQSGRYDPRSESGQRTLAHELTHVVQQRRGAVHGTSIGGGLSVSDPGDAFERAASANADRIIASPRPDPAVHEAPAGRRHVESPVAAPTYAQRQAAPEEEEEAAGLMPQRQAAPEEEEEEGAGLMAQRQAAPEEEEEEAAAGRMG